MLQDREVAVLVTEHLPECPVWRCCKPDERATMHMCICPDDERITEHLPVQRYYLNVRLHTSDVMQPDGNNPNLTERSGDWVLYAEHVYALRACERRVLDAAREAVKHLQHSDDCYYAEGVLCHCEIKRAITAIDALRKEPND